MIVARLDAERGADDALDLRALLLDQRLRLRVALFRRPGDAALAHRRRVGERRLLRERVGRHVVGVDVAADVGQRAQRQAEAERRIARHQEQPLAPERPAFALPAALVAGVPALHRQDEAGGLGQAVGEDAGETGPLLRVVELRIQRIDILGQGLLPGHERHRVLVGGKHVVVLDAEAGCHRHRQTLGIGQRRLRHRLLRRRLGLRRLPQRHSVAPPEQVEGPARQALAGVPLALAKMQQAVRREPVAQPADQVHGERPLHRPVGGGVPLLAVHVVDGNERRLAADRQAHVVGDQPLVDPVPERDYGAPLLLASRAW